MRASVCALPIKSILSIALMMTNGGNDAAHNADTNLSVTGTSPGNASVDVFVEFRLDEAMFDEMRAATVNGRK